MTRLIRALCVTAGLVWLAVHSAVAASAADAAFTQWLTALWPQAFVETGKIFPCLLVA